MWIDHTQRDPWDRYSRVDAMNSTDARAILAQTPYDFNGGEICTSIGTLHNIHVLQHVDRSYSTGMWIDHTQRD
jgi:hypothetical protein